MLKQFLAEIGQVPTFMGPNLAVFWTGFIVNLKAPNPEKARVSIETRFLSH